MSGPGAIGRGPTGPSGSAGAAGATGSTGATGPTGAAGSNGSNGSAGATGATGPAPVTSATTGDLVVATGTNTLGVLPDVAVNRLLASGGVGVVPAYTASPTVTSLTTTSTLTVGGRHIISSSGTLGQSGYTYTFVDNAAPVQTTDAATPKSLWSYALVAGEAIALQATIAAVQSDGSAVFQAFNLQGARRTTGGGAATRTAASGGVNTSVGGTLTCTFTWTTSTTNLQLSINGVAATTVNWTARIVVCGYIN